LVLINLLHPLNGDLSFAAPQVDLGVTRQLEVVKPADHNVVFYAQVRRLHLYPGVLQLGLQLLFIGDVVDLIAVRGVGQTKVGKVDVALQLH